MVLSGLRGPGGLAGAALSRVVEQQTGPSQEGDGALWPGETLRYVLNTVLLTATAGLTAALTGHGEAPEADGGVAGGGPRPGSCYCLT